MLAKRHFSIHEQVVREEIQLPRRCTPRTDPPPPPRPRFPRIQKNLPANSLLLPVQRLKRLARHHHFAAHLKIRPQLHFFQRRRVHPQRHRPDGLHIRRHVLASRAISARHSAHQHAVFVLQRDTQPIELMLCNVFDLFLAASLAHPPVPFPQSVVRKRIVQAEHRPRMPHRGKAFARRPAHAHRRRIRRHQLRMRRLQLFQPLHQPVVRRVRNLRLIQHVIPVFVVAQFLAQLFHLFLHIHSRRLRHLTSALHSSCHFDGLTHICHSERSEESLQPTLIASGPCHSEPAKRVRNLLFLLCVLCASAFRSLRRCSTTCLQPPREFARHYIE